jgi:hypothetical protein
MIRQYDAQQTCDKKLRDYGLYQKGWRTCFDKNEKSLALCHHQEKRIQLSLLFLNGASEVELMNTILHEVAHALVGPGQGHNNVWVNKAREIGLENPVPCGAMNVDAARSIQPSESKPKRQFHRINNACPICGKTAQEKNSIVMNEIKWSMLECGHIVKQEQIKSKEQDYSTWTSESGKVIFPFQVEGIKFLEKAGGRGLIADEPGLGKTIQALGFCYFHKDEACPVLWVCKTTLKLQALKEALDWCGFEFMAQIIDSPKAFILPNHKLYIISMDLLRNMPTEKLDKIGFKTVVADEIQHFKNPDSTRTAELRKLVTKAEFFIPLSGTPWKNRGQEYFPVLNMLDSTRFSSYENFKNRWVDYYTDPKTFKIKQGGIRNIPAFREYTKDMVIRRMRDDVLPDLPKINRQIRFIDMEGLYKKAYDQAEEKVANFIKAAIIDDKNMQSIATEIMKLKHITGLAKVAVAIEDTIEFLEDTEEFEKITLFHHHIDVGDNLQQGDAAKTYEGLDKWLVENGLNKSLRLYGGRSPEERNNVIEKFKSDPKCRVLIASTLASGEGLNIQFCQNAMMVERQWNPANEEQAELRFSRPLTKSDLPEYLQHIAERKISIRIPYLIADGTVDSMLTDIVEMKRHNFRRSMNDKDIELKWSENDIIKELTELIIKKRYGK